MKDSNIYWDKPIFFLLLFFGIVLGFSLLKFLASVLQPIFLAVLISFLFFPLIRKMNKKLHLPFIFGIIIVYILFFGFFIAISNILISSVKAIIISLPEYTERFRTIYERISDHMMNSKSIFSKLMQINANLSFSENMQAFFNLLPTMKKFAVDFTGFIYSFVKSLFLVILFSIFLILEMNLTQRKLALAFNRENKLKINKMVVKIVSEVTRYIWIKFLISLATGFLVFVSGISVGLDFPLVWGFIAFFMNFIPTFGSIISWAVTVIFSIIQFYPNPTPIVFISITVLAINIFLGNIVEPRIEGKNLGLSPFVILVGLSLWGWLWGLLGLFLAVPLLVIIKIICENIDFLHPVAIFIGSKSEVRKQQ